MNVIRVVINFIEELRDNLLKREQQPQIHRDSLLRKKLSMNKSHYLYFFWSQQYHFQKFEV